MNINNKLLLSTSAGLFIILGETNLNASGEQYQYLSRSAPVAIPGALQREREDVLSLITNLEDQASDEESEDGGFSRKPTERHFDFRPGGAALQNTPVSPLPISLTRLTLTSTPSGSEEEEEVQVHPVVDADFFAEPNEERDIALLGELNEAKSAIIELQATCKQFLDRNIGLQTLIRTLEARIKKLESKERSVTPIAGPFYRPEDLPSGYRARFGAKTEEKTPE